MKEEVKGVLTPDILKSFKKEFESDPKNILALNACSKLDPFEICLRRKVIETTNHVFTHKVDSEAKPITNQKTAGTCWIFAALNVLRVPFMKHFQLDDFEFSQSYIIFWDNVEKCNYFLHTIVDVLRRGEDVNGRLMSFLLHEPIPDGGQWDMLVNIIKKYGLVPKKCYPEVYSGETTTKMNYILRTKLREYVRNLKDLLDNGGVADDINVQIEGYMNELYRIISICLGMPPDDFVWEYYDKNKLYGSVGPITPLKFYSDYVKPYCDPENKICFVHDPRLDHPFEKTYTVDCLGNMVGGDKVIYLNLKMNQFLKYAAESIKHNEPVWFGCDIKWGIGKLGIQDMHLHDFKLLFGTESREFSKADRLLYGDSIMNHAMVLTAVSLNEKDEPTKWRIENSWGDDRGDKGYLVMTNEWFLEYGFEAVVDKQYVPKDIIELMKQEPKVLPAWDPMGSLAM